MPQPYFQTNGVNPFGAEINAFNYYGTDSYFILPYSDTQKLLIQYGARPYKSNGETTITFRTAYAVLPAIFLTQWDTGAITPAGRVVDPSVTGFRADMNTGAPDKPAFAWFSIGIY
jgi:hypothetical protein